MFPNYTQGTVILLTANISKHKMVNHLVSMNAVRQLASFLFFLLKEQPLYIAKLFFSRGKVATAKISLQSQD